MALSACPELGWWKQQMRLHSVRHGGRYRMVAVVPARLERVVSLQGICPVVAGDVPVLSLWSRLSAEVRAWYEGEAPRAMPGTGEMPEQQAWALAALLSGGMKRRKTQYNSSYSGLTRLGFYSSQQYRRYYSGLAAGDREGHRRLPG
ncbi:hypothetical protein [Citrobacter portucalensis]|uniref:hypothetical protein n=1 Tax=Citrobacter portucalensis TaxID=1639133 RepID=UPI00288B7963|nr:hypothetical protein [Citrobacter portucalensis]WNI84213.1 hypothetical protein RIK60_00975 [Citrobacter portucalensis]